MSGKRYARRPATADYTGLGVSYLAKAAMRNEGPPFIKIGAAVVYDLDDVDAWMAARKVKSTLETPALNRDASEDTQGCAEVRRPRGRPRRAAGAPPIEPVADRSDDRAA